MDKAKVKAALEAALYASKYGPTRRSRLAWVLRQAGLGLDEANTFIRDAIQARVLVEIDFVWVLMTPSGVALTQDFAKLSSEYDWPDDPIGSFPGAGETARRLEDTTREP